MSVSFSQYDVFLSYSQQDRDLADPFAEELRARGYSVFYDKESIAIGERWKERLGRAIATSRVCILCWSASARNSEYVIFEYSHAEAQGKPVLPWLLDSTPLPQMIEIQGVIEPDPLQAVSRFLPRLGWTLSRRRVARAICLILLLALVGLFYWRAHLPPPPWEFTGRVVDSQTKLAIPGVKVEAEGNRYTTYTDENGKYVLTLPHPRPAHLHLVFAKEGYRGEEPVTVSADRPFDTDMYRLR
jgi:hypothetical protein